MASQGEILRTLKKALILFFLFGLLTRLSPAESTHPADPIQNFLQDLLAHQTLMLSHHKDVRTFFENFIPPWQQLLEKLSTAKSRTDQLQDQFSLYANLAKQAAPSLERIKPPSDFQDFKTAVSKGVEGLSDWCLDMSDRIKYAATDYQKKAYAQRLEGFQNEWYGTFFGPALENLKDAWGVFSTAHWMENLSPEQQLSLKKNPPVLRYLNGYFGIISSHLKTMADLSNKIRQDQDNSDNDAMMSDLQKQHADFDATMAKFKKMKPPPAFQEFYNLDVEWLGDLAKSNAMQMEIEKAKQSHKSDEEIQGLTYERNQADLAAGEAEGKVSDAYNQAMTSVAPAPPTKGK